MTRISQDSADKYFKAYKDLNNYCIIKFKEETMNISELRARQGNINIEAVVKSIEEPRAFNRFGRDLRVTNAVIEDSTGSIKLTLWNNDIDNVHVGDTVRITNGFINEFKGENQLTTGKFGKLEVIKHGAESREEAKETADESEEASEEPAESEEPSEDADEKHAEKPEETAESEEAPEEAAEEEYNEDY